MFYLKENRKGFDLSKSPSTNSTAMSEDKDVELSDTQNETYLNKDLAISFNYPQTWQIREDTNSSNIILRSPNLSYEGARLARGIEVEFTVLKKVENRNLQEIIEQQLIQTSKIFPEEGKNKEVAKLPAIQNHTVLAILEKGAIRSIAVDRSANDYWQINFLYGEKSGYEDYQEVIESIIESLNF